MGRTSSLIELTGASGAFRCDPRFGAAPIAAITSDPAADDFARGYAAGEDAAMRRHEAEATSLAAFETSYARLDAENAEALRRRLADTVLTLCTATLADAAIDPDLLATRIERATAMLVRADDERVVRLHPDDLALVAARLPADWTVRADPALKRGNLRIETASGGVEDGPEQWQIALAEALRTC